MRSLPNSTISDPVYTAGSSTFSASISSRKEERSPLKHRPRMISDSGTGICRPKSRSFKTNGSSYDSTRVSHPPHHGPNNPNIQTKPLFQSVIHNPARCKCLVRYLISLAYLPSAPVGRNPPPHRLPQQRRGLGSLVHHQRSLSRRVYPWLYCLASLKVVYWDLFVEVCAVKDGGDG